jgi:hypothetical protein
MENITKAGLNNFDMDQNTNKLKNNPKQFLRALAMAMWSFQALHA